MGRPALKDHNILFLDFETGGLNPVVSDPVEVACVLTDPSGRTVLAEYEAKVFPTKPVDPQAAAINGYDAEVWKREAIPFKDAMVKVLTHARDSMLAAHNAPFDKGFLEAGLAAHQMRWPGSYHSMCTVALSMPLLRAGLLPNVRLETLTEYFGIPHVKHRALGDVRACREVYVRLMDIYNPGVEKFASERVSAVG